MIIDGHAHAAREYSDAGEIIKVLDKFQIDKVALCPSLKNFTELSDPPGIFPLKKNPESYYFVNRLCRISYRYYIKDMGDGNKFVYSLCRKHPERIIQFYWLNPLEVDYMEQLEMAHGNWNIGGVKLHQACDPFTNYGNEIHSIAEFAGKRNLPIFIHLYSKKETMRFLNILNNYPGTNFITAHLIGLKYFSKHAAHLRNLYFDISGSNLIQVKNIIEAINIFGDDRIIFGTDMPFGKVEYNFKKVDNLNITDKAKQKILGENIAGLLGL